jgi:chromosome partitioning protein
MPILAVLSLKGGVGKTTTAMHLAAVIAERGLNPIVIDCDTETSAVRWATRAGEDLGFQVEPGDTNKLAVQLRAHQKAGRVVIVDGPPNNREIIARVGQMADVVLVPVNPTGLDLDRLNPTLELLADLEAARGELPAYILFTRFSEQRRLDREAQEALAQFPVLDQRIRQLTAYASVFGGTPTYLEEYAHVWDEIADEFKPETLTRMTTKAKTR